MSATSIPLDIADLEEQCPQSLRGGLGSARRHQEKVVATGSHRKASPKGGAHFVQTFDPVWFDLIWIDHWAVGDSFGDSMPSPPE